MFINFLDQISCDKYSEFTCCRFLGEIKSLRIPCLVLPFDCVFQGEDGLVQSEELPFANFSSPKETKVVLEVKLQARLQQKTNFATSFPIFD